MKNDSPAVFLHPMCWLMMREGHDGLEVVVVVGIVVELVVVNRSRNSSKIGRS